MLSPQAYVPRTLPVQIMVYSSLCRQKADTFCLNVHRCVPVTVKYHSTVQAPIGPYLQRHLLSVSTAVTDLTGWIPTVYLDETLSSLCKLINKHVLEHPVSVIHRSLTVAKSFVGLCSHIKVFHTYRIILIGYLSTPLMQVVLPLIVNVACLMAHSTKQLHKVC